MMNIKLILLIKLIVSTSISGYETKSLRRRLDEGEMTPSAPGETNGRPKMHPFFTPISSSPENELIEIWKKT